MAKFFAIKLYWPDLKVAEHEAVARIEASMSKLGFESIRIDQNGYRLDTGNLIQVDEADFCIDLHFLTPKVFPGVSIAAFWNPTDFYRLFGLEQSLRNQLSHDLFVAANVTRATEWLSIVKPEWSGEILPLNHSVPEPFLAPNPLGPSSFFYIGIGWDKTAGQGQRHQDLLKELEKRVPLNIFGPRRLADNSRPWGGFPSYIGELEFDGFSVLAAANQAGVSLSLSSESHLRAGISSNRLFETIAAGAIPVVELELDAPFDLSGAIFIDNTKPIADIITQLEEEFNYLQAHPNEFVSRVEQLQERMRNGFTLDSQLPAIIRAAESLRVEKTFIHSEVNEQIFNVNKHLKRYLGVSDMKMLEPEQVRTISKANYLRRLANELRDSSQEWVAFSEDQDFLRAASELIVVDETSPKSDVFHFQGLSVVDKNVPVVHLSSDSRSSDFRAIDSFIVRKDLLLTWISHGSGYFTVTSLLGLLHEDSVSEDAILSHQKFTNPIFRVAGSGVFHLAGLRCDEDFLVLSRQNYSGLDTVYNSLLARRSFSNESVSQPLHIDYRIILSSLAQIPLAEIPRFVRQGLGLLIRKAAALFKKS